MIENFINALKDFSANTSYIEIVIIVDSYARGTNQESSDLDIVIITPNKSEMVRNQDFVQNFGEVYKKRQNIMVYVLLFVCGIRMGRRLSLGA